MDKEADEDADKKEKKKIKKEKETEILQLITTKILWVWIISS